MIEILYKDADLLVCVKPQGIPSQPDQSGCLDMTAYLKEQLALDGAGYIIADETTKTSVDGVFAIGDVRTKPFRQIATAVADGAVAAHFAEGYVSNIDL